MRRRNALLPFLLAVLVLLGLLGALVARGTPRPSAVSAARLPAPLWGVTLAALPRKPTARLVLDDGDGHTPADFTAAVNALHPIAYLMGEVEDSNRVAQVSASVYASQTASFLRAFGNRIDLWEVGNEVNGSWVGSPATEIAKVHGAYRQVAAAGKASALTLFYNPPSHADCDNGENTLDWARANVPADMKQRLDYVLVSYYPDQCGGYTPSVAEWDGVFSQLRRIFPRARLGFGESDSSAEDRASVAASAVYLGCYYGLAGKIAVPGYVGGYFWWYYQEDMVPYRGNPLWQALASAMTSR